MDEVIRIQRTFEVGLDEYTIEVSGTDALKVAKDFITVNSKIYPEKEEVKQE